MNPAWPASAPSSRRAARSRRRSSGSSSPTELGYDAVYTTHIAGRDSLTVLMAYAAVSERIRLGTGVVPIFSRTPARWRRPRRRSTSSRAAHGARPRRLAPGHGRELVRRRRSTKPVTQMREYVGHRPGDPPRRGRRRTASFFNTNFAFMGYEPRARPADLRRRPVAEHAAARRRDRRRRDALALQPGPTSATSVIPARQRGSRAGGQAMDGFDVVAAVPVGAHRRPARPPATRCARTSSPTPRCPSTGRCSRRSGFADEIAAFDEGMAAGDIERAMAGLSDRMLERAGRDRRGATTSTRRCGATATPARPRRGSAGSPAPTSTRRSSRSPS